MKEEVKKKCELGCKVFYGGEIRHLKECIFYPESFTEMYDRLKQERDGLKAYISGLESEVGEQIAHRILDNPEQELQALKDTVKELLFLFKNSQYPSSCDDLNNRIEIINKLKTQIK